MSENNLPGIVSGGGGNTVYWNIFSGKFARKSNEGEAGAVARTNKNNVKVWEKHEQGLRGLIKDIYMKDSDFGEQLVIHLEPASGWKYMINIPKESRYYGSFLERLPRIHLDEPVEIKPYNFKDDKDKTVSGISVYQDDTKLESAYKEKDGKAWKYLHGFPPFPENWNNLSEKQQTIYWYDVDEFHEKQLKKWRAKYAPEDSKAEFRDAGMKPNPAAESAKSGDAKAKKDEKLNYSNASSPSDDLPFRFDKNYFAINI